MPSFSPRIDMIGIVTSQLPEMKAFYRDVMGFTVQMELEAYVEFVSEGVRFALSTCEVMQKATGREDYATHPGGHSFELAFRVDRAQEVDDVYIHLVQQGATPIKAPETMPWNQRAAFFADPDGNIHEVFADLS